MLKSSIDKPAAKGSYYITFIIMIHKLLHTYALFTHLWNTMLRNPEECSTNPVLWFIQNMQLLKYVKSCLIFYWQGHPFLGATCEILPRSPFRGERLGTPAGWRALCNHLQPPELPGRPRYVPCPLFIKTLPGWIHLTPYLLHHAKLHSCMFISRGLVASSSASCISPVKDIWHCNCCK